MAEAERWLAEYQREGASEIAKLDAEFERWKLPDAEFERLPAAEEPPPRRFRYVGDAAHVPAEYVGQACVVVGDARRKTSVRVAFEDGLRTSIKAKLLEPVTCP